jgi:hypothetical protein
LAAAVGETLVIRPKRVGWVVIAVFMAPAFVVSLAMVFPNSLAPVLDFLNIEQKSAGVWGWLLVALFGSFVVAFVHKLVAPGLVLTSETLQIGWYKVAWTDVDDFRKDGFFHVRVVYAPGHELSLRERLSVWLGYVDFYFGPTYITTAYHTDGVALDLLLRRWRLKYGR